MVTVLASTVLTYTLINTRFYFQSFFSSYSVPPDLLLSVIVGNTCVRGENWKLLVTGKAGALVFQTESNFLFVFYLECFPHMKHAFVKFLFTEIIFITLYPMLLFPYKPICCEMINF